MRYCHNLEGLNRLLEVTHLLAVEMNLAKILDAVVCVASRALACDRALLYLHDPKRNVLRLSATSAGGNLELHLTLDKGAAGFAARRREMVNIAQPNADPRCDRTYDQTAGYRTDSLLATPLIAGRDGRLLGVLEFLNNSGGPFDNDDEALALAFSEHAAAALDRARLLEELERQHQKAASLEIAREVQRRFMPSKLPEIPGYEAAAWWYPNEEVGGDYCDLIQIPSGPAALCVADVSGHGLGPSLLMASVRASLRTLLAHERPTPQLLDKLAWALAPDLQDGQFVTMVLALLDPSTHRVEFANAGHAPAFHYVRRSDEFMDLHSTGLPLGVLDPPDTPLGPAFTMEEGDMLVLATDGVVEAMDSRGKQFGVNRLREELRRLYPGSLPDLVRNVGREVELHYVGDSPPDDLTIVALRRVS